MAQMVRDEYAGDLRNLAEAGEHDVAKVKKLLQEFKGIGETGADIFLREVQAVWGWAAPYFDKRARETARRLGLPAQADELAELAPRATAELAAALVRTSLE
jgi:hypothetical protein